MTTEQNGLTQNQQPSAAEGKKVNRRNFLKFGALTAGALVLSTCSTQKEGKPILPSPDPSETPALPKNPVTPGKEVAPTSIPEPLPSATHPAPEPTPLPKPILSYDYFNIKEISLGGGGDKIRSVEEPWVTELTSRSASLTSDERVALNTVAYLRLMANEEGPETAITGIRIEGKLLTANLNIRNKPDITPEYIKGTVIPSEKIYLLGSVPSRPEEKNRDWVFGLVRKIEEGRDEKGNPFTKLTDRFGFMAVREGETKLMATSSPWNTIPELDQKIVTALEKTMDLKPAAVPTPVATATPEKSNPDNRIYKTERYPGTGGVDMSKEKLEGIGYYYFREGGADIFMDSVMLAFATQKGISREKFWEEVKAGGMKAKVLMFETNYSSNDVSLITPVEKEIDFAKPVALEISYETPRDIPVIGLNAWLEPAKTDMWRAGGVRKNGQLVFIANGNIMEYILTRSPSGQVIPVYDAVVVMGLIAELPKLGGKVESFRLQPDQRLVLRVVRAYGGDPRTDIQRIEALEYPLYGGETKDPVKVGKAAVFQFRPEP